MPTQAFRDIDGQLANDLLNISVESGAIRVAQFRCDGTVTVARTEDSEGAPSIPTFEDGTLCLPSQYVSRGRHCTIEALNGSRLRVIDHDSTNGTRLDGRFVVREVVTATPCRLQLHPFELMISRQDDAPDTRPLRAAQRATSDLQVEDESGTILTPSGRIVRGLTPVQRELLETLIRRHPEWVSSAELATIAGGSGSSDQSVYSQIHLIRRRLDEAEVGAAELLVSRRRRGYSVTPRPL